MPSKALTFGPVRASHLRAGLEAALVIGLAVQAARLVWIFLAPAPPPPPVQVAGAPRGGDPSILTRLNPFEGAPAGRATASVAAEGQGGLSLFGVRTGPPASAILGAAGGPQGSYAVGEEVAPGVVLSAVAVDHVVLSRGGVLSRLAITPAPMGAPSQMAMTSAPPPPPPPAARGAGGVDAARFLSEAGLRPRAEGGGYTIVSRGGALLGQLGLASGDVILSVNGQPLTPALHAELAEQLASSPTATLTVERAGAQRTLTLNTGR